MVGVWKGLRDTVGFKPFRYLLMINVLSWFAFQVCNACVQLMDDTVVANIRHSFVHYTVPAKQYCPLHQVLPWFGQALPLHHSHLPGSNDCLELPFARDHHQVWEEECSLLWFGGITSNTYCPPFSGLLPSGGVCGSCYFGDGCFQCFPGPMVRLSLVCLIAQ